MKNRYNSINRLTLTLLTLLAVCLFCVNENAWAKYTRTFNATCNVQSDPLEAGWVYVAQSAQSSMTKDRHVDASSPSYTDERYFERYLDKSHTFNFYAYQEAAISGYTFKGWATSTSVNSGSESSLTNWDGIIYRSLAFYPFSITVSGNNSTNSASATYYAIYAGIVSTSNTTSASLAFGNVNVGSSKEMTLVFKHAHAGKISGSFGGTNSGDFKLKTGTTLPTASTTQANCTITVVFTPSCGGDRSATLTLTGDNGGSMTVNLSGKGVRHTPSMTTTNGSVNVSVGSTPTTTNLNDRVTCANTEGKKTYTCSNSVVTINDNLFSATKAGNYTVSVSVAQTCYYAKKDGSFTITVNRLDPTLTATDGEVNVSIDGINSSSLNLADKISYNGNGTLSYKVVSANKNDATISGSSFSATECGDYTVRAVSTQTDQYLKDSVEFTVTVNKLQPTFSWWNANGATNIYAGDELSNVAQAKYNGNNVAGLTYHYESSDKTRAVVDGTTIRIPSSGFTVAGTVTITVTTEENSYYEEGEDTHDYYIEPKATPLFKLDGVDLPESPVKLTLLIGQTANMAFENTDESNGLFTYPTSPTYITYTHNSQNHTGVITGTAYGDEFIQFNQTGTGTIFSHIRKIHVFVNKHEVELSTTMNTGVWKVDSVYDGTLYSLSDTPENGEPAQESVIITSGNTKVIDFVDGHWKAVGAGTSVMTFAMKNNAYWTGDTITATITVEKYDPVITWNLENRYPWGAQKANPVSSSCELPFSVSSSDATIADYVDGRIEVYNIVGNVTFTLTQKGNYKWNDASANLTKTISCFKPDNRVPFSVLNNNHSNYESYFTGSAEWDSPAYVLGDGGWGTQDDYVILHFTGVPDKLKFDKTLSTSWGQLPGTYLCQVYQSTDGTNWGDPIWEHNERVAEKNGNEVQLSASTQYVKFAYHGTVHCNYKNIKVLERKEVSAAVDKLTFTTAPVDAAAQTLSVKVNWYNVKTCAVSITGTNAAFFTLVEGSESIESSINHFGDKTLYVKYAYPESGTHSATLHIESEDGYTADVALEATSTKLTPSIQWKENLSPMSRGENVENPASAPVTLVYASSDSTVVDVEGNTLKPLKKGNATITASFDGTSDKKWNSVSDTYDVIVTDMKVLHINWPQTFTRLKYVENDPTKTTADFDLIATVSYFDPDTREEISTNRAVTFTSQNDAVVQVLPGNVLHVAGLGTTTLTARVDGVENEFIEANVVRAVKVREPSTDCDTYILEDAHNSMLTEINSFSGVETVYDLSEEPGYLTFSAWTEKWYLGRIGIDPNGDMKVALYIDGEWSNAIWSNSLEVNHEQSFGPFELDRRATKIKFYKEVGSTCYHNFSEAYITLARYVELENTKDMTSMDLYFSTADAKPGVPVVKTFTVNYSNITDQLVLDYEGSDKFTVLSPSSIGEECGDKGTATVQVQFLSHGVDHYEGTLTIHNTNQSVTINLSADVDKHAQNITWNPETLNLNTTDTVTFDATTSGSSAGLSVRYSVTNGDDVATVNANTGKLTILKDGDVTVQADADGDGTTYYNAEPVSYIFHISKVTPEITTIPTAATMTMPNTNLGSCGLTGGEATVEGSFAWADNTINATRNNDGYTVVFNPKNSNWYNTTTCTVVVPVNKQVNEITWNFNVAEMYCNANYTFDAYATSGLDIRYETSADTIAYVDGNNHLSIIRGGEVTITAYEDGDENWASAEPVSKTFTIKRFTPEIITLPTAESMLIGRLLDDASLTGGIVKLDNVTVEGSFAWVDGGTQMNTAGPFTMDIVFNPANSNYYEPVYDTMTVVVEKYSPDIISVYAGGTQITYGQTLASSTLEGIVIAEDHVKVPADTVTGSIVWADPDEKPEAGSPTYASAVFIPDNKDWYEVAFFEAPLTVLASSAATYSATTTLVHGQTLAEAVLTNTTTGLYGETVSGTVEWASSVDQTIVPAYGETYTFAINFTSADDNYTGGIGLCTVTIEEGVIFDGSGEGTVVTDWSEDANWKEDAKPGTSDRVTIAADVDITDNVTIGGITINAGKTVTVKSGATLEVGNYNSFNREAYGNIHVEKGGKLILNAGQVDVNNLYMDAALGGRNSETRAFINAKSAQITNIAQLDVHADAFFDVALDPNGECTPGWYDFTVPFPVDVATGVSRFEENGVLNTNLRQEVNYAIMDYHEDIRATGQYGWKKYRSVMQPGVCYTMTIDNYYNVYRFRKVAGAPLTNHTSVNMTRTGESSVYSGWNCIGNGSFNYANLGVDGIDKVQIYDHYTNAYTPIDIDGNSFVVGSAFFVQAITHNSTMSYDEASSESLYAPSRTNGRTLTEYLLHLTREGEATFSDALYVSASEDALDAYQAGHDLSKFEVSSKTAQIWADAYGQKLCAVETPLVANQAIIPISLYAAQTGTYTLDVVRGPQDASLYLMYNGAVVWNLSQSAYTFDLTRGTNSAYSLLLTAEAPAVTTGADAISGENEQTVEKILLNGQLYILRDGQMYDATGKKVK